MIDLLVGLSVILLALALVAVSYIAYRKSHLRAALYLLLAFLLLAVKKAIELSIRTGLEREAGLVVDALEVIVLLLFFLALWRR
ncbi:hypothetical protein [Thermococcus sp.]|uniref:hypothetical protein n=1 Tax=Thermococcus sp. TaxID=35749 RepID=UPI0026372869|nr:hypothetical protein [Thermococcus sp.]